MSPKTGKGEFCHSAVANDKLAGIEGTVLISSSLRLLCALGVSTVIVFEPMVHRRDTKVGENTQRQTEL